MRRELVASLTARIVAAYLAGNEGKVPVSSMAGIVRAVGRALGGEKDPVVPPSVSEPAAPPAAFLIRPTQPPFVKLPRPKPAIPIAASLTSERIVCLVCGWEGVTLRRHLGQSHRLTPEHYRELFRLRPDYPMEAPDYRKVRGELAKARGLGSLIIWEERPRAWNRGQRPSRSKRKP